MKLLEKAILNEDRLLILPEPRKERRKSVMATCLNNLSSCWVLLGFLLYDGSALEEGEKLPWNWNNCFVLCSQIHLKNRWCRYVIIVMNFFQSVVCIIRRSKKQLGIACSFSSEIIKNFCRSWFKLFFEKFVNLMSFQQ